MARQRRPASEYQPPEVRRGRYGPLTLYEVSEEELEALARGTPNSTYLNLAIALLSAAASFIVALTSTTIESDRTFTVFVVFAVVGIVVGAALLVVWYRGSKSMSDLVETVKRRLPPEGVQEQTGLPPSS